MIDNVSGKYDMDILNKIGVSRNLYWNVSGNLNIWKVYKKTRIFIDAISFKRVNFFVLSKYLKILGNWK